MIWRKFLYSLNVSELFVNLVGLFQINWRGFGMIWPNKIILIAIIHLTDQPRTHLLFIISFIKTFVHIFVWASLHRYFILILHIAVNNYNPPWVENASFSARSLSEPMLTKCQVNPLEQTTVKFESNYNIILSRLCISKCHLQNGSHFSLASIWECLVNAF